MRTALGACVRRARLAAALGRPIPTKHTTRSCSIRAAATVIISSAVYSCLAIGLPARPGAARRRDTAPKLRKIFGREHVALDPSRESIALARDLVPLPIKCIVARIVAHRVRRKSTARDLAHRPDYPSRQHN